MKKIKILSVTNSKGITLKIGDVFQDKMDELLKTKHKIKSFEVKASSNIREYEHGNFYVMAHVEKKKGDGLVAVNIDFITKILN